MVGSYYSCTCNMTACACNSTTPYLYIKTTIYHGADPIRSDLPPEPSRREAMEPTYRPGPAPVIPRYVDKYRAWRPTQQRARDGTAVRHKTGGLRKVS